MRRLAGIGSVLANKVIPLAGLNEMGHGLPVGSGPFATVRIENVGAHAVGTRGIFARCIGVIHPRLPLTKPSIGVTDALTHHIYISDWIAIRKVENFRLDPHLPR